MRPYRRRRYPGGTHMVGAAVMLLTGLAGWIFFRNMHERTLQRIMAQDLWIPSWDVAQFRDLTLRVESNYAASVHALALHDHAGAFALSRAREKLQLEPWVEHHPNREFQPGHTVRAWYDELEARYFGAVMAEYAWTAKAVREGQRTIQDLEQLVAWHPEILGLRERFDAERMAISQSAPGGSEATPALPVTRSAQ